MGHANRSASDARPLARSTRSAFWCGSGLCLQVGICGLVGWATFVMTVEHLLPTAAALSWPRASEGERLPPPWSRPEQMVASPAGPNRKAAEASEPEQIPSRLASFPGSPSRGGRG